MSDEKKYTAEEAAKMVLKKAYDMLKERQDMDKCGDMKVAKDEHVHEAIADIKGPKKVNEVLEDTPQEKRKKVLDKLRSDKLKKFMAKKEEKRVKQDTPENLKGVDNKKDYTPNPKDC